MTKDVDYGKTDVTDRHKKGRTSKDHDGELWMRVKDWPTFPRRILCSVVRLLTPLVSFSVAGYFNWQWGSSLVFVSYCMFMPPWYFAPQFTVSILFKHFRLRNFKVQLQYAVANSKYLAYTLASFNVLIYCSFTNAFYSFHTISLSLAMFQYYLSMYIFSRPLPSFKYRDGWMATPKWPREGHQWSPGRGSCSLDVCRVREGLRSHCCQTFRRLNKLFCHEVISKTCLCVKCSDCWMYCCCWFPFIYL